MPPSLRHFNFYRRKRGGLLLRSGALSLMRPMNRSASLFSSSRALWRRVSAVLVLETALLVCACVPPASPKSEVQEPAPAPEGAIPWAPGEEPSSAEATTRDVAAEPKQEAPAPVYYEEDGVQETGSGPVCSGKAPPALRALVDARAQETKDCSQKIPLHRAGAGGDMKASVRVTRAGQVESVEILSDSLGVPEVTSCVKEMLGKPFTAAPPRGGCTVFVLPLHFESAPVDASEAPDVEAEATDKKTSPEEDVSPE